MIEGIIASGILFWLLNQENSDSGLDGIQGLNYLDLFSGCGGFHKALVKAGIPLNTTYFSEVDHDAIGNYQYNFPNAQPLGDIRKISANDIPTKINLCTFGFPCQDLSLAGGKKGITRKTRSGLFFEVIRLLQELDQQGKCPDLIIFENVKGLLTHDRGNTFEKVKKAITDLGIYEFAEWQLCNTDWFLPQNRERIFFVAYRGSKKGLQGILPIEGGLGSDSEKRKRTTHIPVSINSSDQKTQYFRDKRGSFTITANEPQGLVTVDLAYPDSAANGSKFIQDKARTLTTNQPPGLLLKNKRIRRFTEIECERLQGFPDDWTKYGIDSNGKKYEITKWQRYKLLGNSISVPVAEVIFQNSKPFLI
ncbi:DNA cytosine methyltransferase [Persicobacter sp. CCB-QB2]|uniref:DNA cytosine methyltransferase n=1 Tax=Persicobacter sp. CCB-QB2 TaxID=1561025 RepID=UPI0006A9825B|nr:DNA (cytosine-5-)-methyltransferase [Persicobacter sp. CCB-QB2]